MNGPSQCAEIQKITWAGLIANLLLAGAKCAAGTLGCSQAVFADGIHSLTDMTTDIAILLGVRYWTKPADSDHPHGHGRIETMVTLGIGLVLALVATGMLWNAISTLHDHKDTRPGAIALVAALISIVVKEALYRWTMVTGRRLRSAALVANAWHHRSDAFSSVPAALAVGGAMIWPAWAFLDHVGAVVVSFFIYQATYKIVRPAFDALIDAAAPDEHLSQIKQIAMDTQGVRDVHKIRTRYAAGPSLLVDLHVLVAPEMTVREGHRVSGAVKARLLEQGPDVLDVLVHLEPSES